MRARGANATAKLAFETTYGTSPGSGFKNIPFVSSNLGEERGLIDSDLLGLGREMADPTQDVAVNDGDIVVPVDLRNFWLWLKLAMGDPASSTASLAATGLITFTAQPAANSTITLGGTAFTFVTGTPTGNQIQIGANLAATLTAAATALNASAVPAIAAATYGSTATTLTITHDTIGVAGNAFTVAASATSNGTVSGAKLTGGAVDHTFNSGATTLPSASIEIGHPQVPSFGVNFGAMVNQLRVQMQRSGLLNCTAAIIAQGEAASAPTTVDGSSTSIDPSGSLPIRFAQATGAILMDGVAIGSIVSADVTYSNNLDKVEVIRSDGRIAGADPAMAQASGSITARYDSDALQLKATSGTPVALQFKWAIGVYTLTFTVQRVFLPRTKRPVSGPAGVQETHNFSSSGAGGPCFSAVLRNDVASY